MGSPWRKLKPMSPAASALLPRPGAARRTPYLYAQLVATFNVPSRTCEGLLDRYNRTRLPSSGSLALNAGLDDYLAPGRLPSCGSAGAVTGPNPYWMGFYASRPEAKRGANRIVRQLVVAEKLRYCRRGRRQACPPSTFSSSPRCARLRRAWDLCVEQSPRLHHRNVARSIWQESNSPGSSKPKTWPNRALARIRTIRPSS